MADFDRFFEEERDRLLRLCWLATLDREVAAEVAQEAMARAWERWDTLSGDGSNPAAWVTTVALNLARSRWRSLRRAAANRSFGSSDVAESAGLSDPALLQAIRSLSRRQCEAVLLRYWADLSVDQCARIMGVSPGSVKRHLGRAHDHLRNLVSPSTLEEVQL